MNQRFYHRISILFLLLCVSFGFNTSFGQAPTVTSPVVYCKDATASALSATALPGNVLRWYTVPTGGAFTLTPITPATGSVGTISYYVSQFDGTTESARATINVTINALPSNPSVVSPVDYCQNATGAVLIASGTSLLWYTGATGGIGSSTTPTISTASVTTTDYYVTQSSGTPVCESLRELIRITIKALPSTPTGTTTYNYCVGASAPTLSATGTGLKWYTVPTLGTASTTAPTPSTSSPGTTTYYVSQTDATTGCESARLAITVNVNAYPVAGTTVSETSGTASNDGITCAGAPVTITGTGGGTYTWSTGATTAAINVSPTATTTFTVTVSNVGCTTTATRTITVNPLPSPTIAVTETSGTTADDGNICTGTSATLTATGGGTYAWSTGATTAAISVSPTATTTYTVTVTNSNNCSATLTRTITVNPLPTIGVVVNETAGLFNNDAILCDGDRGTLVATGGTSYQWWYTGILYATGPSWNIGFSGVGIFPIKVIVTNASGCVDSIIQNVFTNPRPSASIAVTETSGTTANDAIICNGHSATMTASGGGTYAWSTGATTAGITVSPTTTTTYTVTVTNPANNCSITATQTITVNPLPGPITVAETSGLTANDGIICAGATATLSVSGSVTHNWSTGATTSSISVSPSTTTTYSCTTTNANNCTAVLFYTINVTPLPTPSISVTETSGTNTNDGITCSGASVGLAATGGTSYVWSTGATTASISVSPTTTTTYTVTATSTGCTNTATQTIIVNPLPTISGALSGCVGFNYTLTGSGTPHATPWASSNTTVATISALGLVSALSPGTTTITYRNNLGCSITATFTVNAIPTAPTVSSPLTLCFGSTASALTATGTGLLWYVASLGGTGSATAPIPLTTSVGLTPYYVSQTVLGCESPRATLAVNVVSLPAAPTVTTPTFTYCEAATAVTTLSAAGTGLKWYTTATGGTGVTTAPTPSTAIPGIYNYYVVSTSSTAPFCESPRTPYTITVNPKPVVSTVAASATTFCAGDSVTLNSTTSVFNGFGSTSYLQANGASGTPTACDCPNGSVVVGYQGETGAWVDRFAMICKPIDRFGVLGSTTSVTTYNGFNVGPAPKGPFTFTGTDILVGLLAKNESWTAANYLGEVAGFGQSQTYVTGFGNNTVSPSSLSIIAGAGAWNVLGTIYTPNGTVASGMNSYPTFYSSGVSLRYTPIGAYKYNYSWSSAPTTDTNASKVIKTSGSYTLTVTNSLGCSTVTAPIVVTVNPFPVPAIAVAETSGTTANDSIICNGAAATLTASGGTTYVWSTGATTAAISVSPTSTTTYTVTATSVGCSSSATRKITVNPLPTAAIAVVESSGTTANDAITCAGATATLTASGGTSYLWSTGATTAAISVSPSSTTTYTVTVTNANNCSATTSQTITVNPLPTAATAVTETSGIANDDGIICTGASATITASGGTTYLWSTGATTAAISVSPTATTTYAVTVTNANNCSATSTRTITVNPLPTPSTTVAETSGTANNDGIICVGASVTTTASGGTSYLWSTGATTAAITTSPTTTTTYTVTVTNANGCQATTTRIITVNPLPTPAIAVVESSGVAVNDAITCAGATVTLTASGGTTYLWSTGATTAAINVSPTTTTSYTVTVTNANNCSATATQTITVNPLPTAANTVAETSGTTANDGIICTGATATITASGGTTYVWSTGATTAAISVSPTATTTYTVTVTNANNCSATTTRTITVNPLPTPSISVAETSGVAANDAITCAGASVTMTASGGTTYSWSTGATTAALTASPTATTTYTVTVTNANGCQATSAQTITVNPLPTPATTAAETSGTANDDGIICIGASVSIGATGGTTYLWSTGATTSTISVSPTSTTTYTVTVTNANNCSASTTRTITVNPLPTIVTTVAETSGNANNDGIICIGTSASITASGGTTYSWSTGATTATISVAPTSTTTYTVTVTNANNCTSTATRTITVNPLPTVTISSSSPFGFVYCRGLSVVLKANSATATSYAWAYTGVPVSSTFDTVWANKTGRWTSTVKNTFGCIAKDSVWVYEDTSKKSIMSPTSAIICLEGSVLLTVSPGYVSYSYQWLRDGITITPPTPKDNHKNANLAGTYTVYVTNGVGCFDTVQAIVTTYPKPIKPVITHTPPTMKVPAIYVYYQWYRNNVQIVGANNYQLISTTPGKYFVQVTDENGCLNNSDTIEILQGSAIKNVTANGVIKIYPNPTQSIVNIEAPMAINVIVTDLTGRKVFEAKDAKSVNLENYADGTYIFRLLDESNQLISIQKISKTSSR